MPSREVSLCFYLHGRNEFARHQGFALQNAWDAPLGAKQENFAKALPDTKKDPGHLQCPGPLIGSIT